MSAPKPKKPKWSDGTESSIELLNFFSKDIIVHMFGLLSISDVSQTLATSKRVLEIGIQAFENRRCLKMYEDKNWDNILSVVKKYCTRLETLESLSPAFHCSGAPLYSDEILSLNPNITTLTGPLFFSVPTITTLTDLTTLSTTIKSSVDIPILQNFQHLCVLKMDGLRYDVELSIDDSCTSDSLESLAICKMHHIISPTQTFSNIREFFTVHCRVTNENCRLLARYLPNLENMMLGLEENVTDVGVSYFAFSKKLEAMCLVRTAVTQTLLKLIGEEGRFLQLSLLQVSFPWDVRSREGQVFSRLRPNCVVVCE